MRENNYRGDSIRPENFKGEKGIRDLWEIGISTWETASGIDRICPCYPATDCDAARRPRRLRGRDSAGDFRPCDPRNRRNDRRQTAAAATDADAGADAFADAVAEAAAVAANRIEVSPGPESSSASASSASSSTRTRQSFLDR